MGRHDTISHYEEFTKPAMPATCGTDSRMRATPWNPATHGPRWSPTDMAPPMPSMGGWKRSTTAFPTPHPTGKPDLTKRSVLVHVLCFPYPNGPRTAVIYPVDGQRDVPVDFDSDIEWPDPAPDHGVVGYPITLTVAATSATDGDNPYNLYVLDATLTDDSGRKSIALP